MPIDPLYAVTSTAIGRTADVGDFEVYPRLGSMVDDPIPPQGPGLILSGGHGHVKDAYRWMHKVITGDGQRRGGDIVVIRATPDDSYSEQIMSSAPFNSVQTICVPEDATPQQLARAAAIVDKAEGVFFSGGQQSRYVAWQNSALISAAQSVYDRGGVLGGTSAGLAILGEHIFDGRKARSSQVTTDALVDDPDTDAASFTHDLFDFAPLRNTITDTHFAERDRFGRLVTFMSRQDEPQILGIGVDEETALVIDKLGIGSLKRITPGKGNAYLIEGRGNNVAPDRPLGPVSTTVHRIDESSDRFDFNTWQGGDTYEVVVDGARSAVTSVDPYTGR